MVYTIGSLLSSPPLDCMGYCSGPPKLKVFYSHVPLACGLAGSAATSGWRDATLTPSAGSVYYLMTAANCAAEGPSGADPALSTCPP